MGYVEVPVETNPPDLYDEQRTFIEGSIDGFAVVPSSLLDVVLHANANTQSELRDVAADVPAAIFRQLGLIAGLPPLEPEVASVNSTWTLTAAAVADGDPHTIEAGVTVAIGGQLFRVASDVVVPAGDAATATGGVLLVAADPGVQGNDLTGPVALQDSLAFIAQPVTLVAPTSGGADGEDDLEYIDRLSDLLQLQSPRPLTARDFEVLALTIPDVGRAVCLDTYNPADDSWDNEGYATIAVATTEGDPVSSGTKTDVRNLLTDDDQRMPGLVVNVIDPTVTAIDVEFTAVAIRGADPALVEADAIAAVEAYLTPSSDESPWGPPSLSVGSGIGVVPWRDLLVIRRSELVVALNAVAGLDYVDLDNLLIAEAGGTPAAADVTLDGVAPLPQAGAVSGAVSAPA